MKNAQEDKRTLIDALEEALNDTTPEKPGVPDTWKKSVIEDHIIKEENDWF